MKDESFVSDKRFRASFEKVQRRLKNLLQRKPMLAIGLEITLANASALAKKVLHENIYTGLDEEYNLNGWPKTVEEWSGILENPKNGEEFKKDKRGDPDCFLWLAATWLPNEEGIAWKGKNGYNEKLYHIICHFYFLIAVKWADGGRHIPDSSFIQPQLDDDFNKWLIEFIKVNEIFLDSEHSLQKFKGNFSWDEICNDPDIRDSDQYKGYTLHRFKDNMNSWKTFNQFFYRRFNGANHRNGGISPTETKIHDPEENRTITSPAFCTYKERFSIEENGDIVAIDKFPSYEKNNGLYDIVTKNWSEYTNKEKEPIRMHDISTKNGKVSAVTHTKGVPVSNIADLIQSSNHFEDFCGGTFVHYYLSAYEYHRCHLPVSGKVVEAKHIPGYSYTHVVVTKEEGGAKGDLDAPDDATDGFEFVQSRGLLIIDTKYYLDENGVMQEESNGPADVGKVAILPIGLSQVSGVGINETLEGEVVPKGWEFGRFKFGGSDLIILFDKRAKLEFENDKGEYKHYELGEPIARVTDVKRT